VHRDINTNNLYAPEGRPGDAKIFDLGVARTTHGSLTSGGDGKFMADGSFTYQSVLVGGTLDVGAGGKVQFSLDNVGNSRVGLVKAGGSGFHMYVPNGGLVDGNGDALNFQAGGDCTLRVKDNVGIMSSDRSARGKHKRDADGRSFGQYRFRRVVDGS